MPLEWSGIVTNGLFVSFSFTHTSSISYLIAGICLNPVDIGDQSSDSGFSENLITLLRPSHHSLLRNYPIPLCKLIVLLLLLAFIRGIEGGNR